MIKELYSLFQTSSGISTDTRQIKANSIFFALKGERFNANKFAEQALKKGASYAIVDEKEHQTKQQIILVDDVLKTLQKLASYHRKQLGLPIIALTGSNGKTTTKELINTVLSQKFKTKATLGNLNNHIGVPLTLLSMDKDTEIGIVEMGANHPKEIEFLCHIATPDYGYITNFGKAHLEGFGSIDGVIKAKTELYDYLKKHHKTVFVNANDNTQLEKSKNIQQITFGTQNTDYPIELISANPFVKIKFEDTIANSNMIGLYNYNNIAAAIAIGKYFKVTNNSIKTAIEDYTPTNNRSQIIQKKNAKIILDAYNANPSSMQSAIANFKQLSDSKKIIILGDMFELGNFAKEEHQIIINSVNDNSFFKVFLIGEHFNSVSTKNKNTFFLKDFEAFKELFNKETFNNATILIKASRGMALERIVTLFD